MEQFGMILLEQIEIRMKIINLKQLMKIMQVDIQYVKQWILMKELDGKVNFHQLKINLKIIMLLEEAIQQMKLFML